MIIGRNKLGSVLGRNQPRSIIQSAGHQGIAGIEIALRLNIDNDLVSRGRRQSGIKEDVENDLPFGRVKGFVEATADQRGKVALGFDQAFDEIKGKGSERREGFFQKRSEDRAKTEQGATGGIISLFEIDKREGIRKK